MKSDRREGKNAVFFTDVVRFAHIAKGLESTFVEIAGVLKKDWVIENKTLKMPPFFDYVNHRLFFIVRKFQGWKHISFN